MDLKIESLGKIDTRFITDLILIFLRCNLVLYLLIIIYSAFPAFPAFLTIPILPHSYFKEKLETGELFIEEIVDPDYPFNKKPIGAGPYVVKNVVPNDDGSFRVFMEKNKYFYRGAPNIDQLVFYVYPSMDHLKSAKRESGRCWKSWL